MLPVAAALLFRSGQKSNADRYLSLTCCSAYEDLKRGDAENAEGMLGQELCALSASAFLLLTQLSSLLVDAVACLAYFPCRWGHAFSRRLFYLQLRSSDRRGAIVLFGELIQEEFETRRCGERRGMLG
ncbi:MAG TPA: hypothetical protein DDW52_26640, partial [Planctomycetaceae bacterium]|nr:hypothetical protein [Planctomycetaceae bacterium]